MASESQYIIDSSTTYTYASERLEMTLSAPAQLQNNGGVITKELVKCGYDMQASARATFNLCSQELEVAMSHASRISRMALAIKLTNIAFFSAGTAGAGFGYHYLTKFIYEDLDSFLFGD